MASLSRKMNVIRHMNFIIAHGNYTMFGNNSSNSSCFQPPHLHVQAKLSFSDANMITVGSFRISVVNLSCSPDWLGIDESCRVSKRYVVQITTFTSGVLWPMTSLNLQNHRMERTWESLGPWLTWLILTWQTFCVKFWACSSGDSASKSCRALKRWRTFHSKVLLQRIHPRPK